MTTDFHDLSDIPDLPPEALAPTSRGAFRAWLAANHNQAERAWLVFFKKGSGVSGIAYPEAVKEALCFGWIDSVVAKVDGRCYRQLFTPRKPKSVWSALNKRYLQELEAEGLLEAPGLAAIERAKGNGSWSALDDAESEVVPADFAEALSSVSGAEAGYSAWPARVRKTVLSQVYGAKRPETRAKRIALYVGQAARGERPF